MVFTKGALIMKNQKFIPILLAVFFTLGFTSCGNSTTEKNDIPEEELYFTTYKEEEFSQKLNDWNTKKPENYSFEYHYVRNFDDSNFDIYAEVTVKDDKSEVVFFEEYKDSKTKQTVRSYDIKGTKPVKGDDDFIDSLDDFFSKIKTLSTKYVESTEVQKVYSVEFQVTYDSEKSYPNDVIFILQDTEKEEFLDGMDTSDYKFLVTISNFKILQ